MITVFKDYKYDALCNSISVLSLIEMARCLHNLGDRCAILLIRCGGYKINTIKCVRAYMDLSLKDAKDLVEKPYNIILGNHEKMCEELKVLGADVYYHKGNCDECKDRFTCFTGTERNIIPDERTITLVTPIKNHGGNTWNIKY